MCVTFFYISGATKSKYKLIIANNRDELLDRATKESEWKKGVLAGRDQKDACNGTWICMNKSGQIANLLTLTVPIQEVNRSAPSRGQIPLNFVMSGTSGLEFCKSLEDNAFNFNPYHILCFERNVNDEYDCYALATALVDKIEPKMLQPGIHGVSNTPISKPLKKVAHGVNLMQKVVREIENGDICEEKVISDLLTVLTDRKQCFPDDLLKKQCGRSSEMCRFRTALFVEYPAGIRYGTRTHTIILVDRRNNVTFFEKTMVNISKMQNDAEWNEQIFHFTLS